MAGDVRADPEVGPERSRTTARSNTEFDPDVHHRRSVRLKGCDYSQPGGYFVTVCVQDRICLFGDIVDREMRLNARGHMVDRWWNELGTKYPTVDMDEYVVMPNHLHGIVVLSTSEAHGPDHSGPLHALVRWFKTMTTNEYLRGVKRREWPSVRRRLWQRNYYEHVIRGETELSKIREYIRGNPTKWPEDPDNPMYVEPTVT